MVINKSKNVKLSENKISKKNTIYRKMINDKYSKKNYYKNKFKNLFKKYIIVIIVVIILFIIFKLYINSNKKLNIDENSNISELNASVYSEEIVNLYNRDDELDKFLNEMIKVQSLIGTYLISNCTLKENSFDELIKKLNNEINNDDWILLNFKSDEELKKSIYYNGKYSIDDEGNLKFKFANKDIEPNWIEDSSISRYIIFN